MSSYKEKKRKVLQVRKRTKKRLKTTDESLGLKRREGLYRSEGARVRGSITSSLIGRSWCVSGNHHLLDTSKEDKLEMALKSIHRIQHKYVCSEQKSNPRRRKAATVIFVKSKASARELESRLGNPVTKKSSKQAKYARHSFKPKGQGRVGGRSTGPGDGITIASTYRSKGVAVLHARSGEKEEENICTDLRSGKLRYVIVAESGKIGCGDPLWELRDYIGLVVVYDVQHHDASKVCDVYDALSSYGGLGLCGCRTTHPPNPIFAHRPHILSFVSNSNCDTSKSLISHLRKLGDQENHELFLPKLMDGGVSDLRRRLFEFYMERNEKKTEDAITIGKIVLKCMLDEKKESTKQNCIDEKKSDSLFLALSKRYPRPKSEKSK